MLAARDLGLGTTLTTVFRVDIDEVRRAFDARRPPRSRGAGADRPTARSLRRRAPQADREDHPLEPLRRAPAVRHPALDTDGVTAATRPVLGSADELLAGADSRQVLRSADSKSGALIERVVIGGEHFIAKQLSVAKDWTMRASGDLCGRTLLLWQHGILDRLPDDVDHTVVAVAHDPATRVTTLLMRDVGAHLVPEGDAPISLADHRAFVGSMASVHARFHGWQDDIGLATMADRYLELSPLMAEGERWLGEPSLVPRLVGEGWERLPSLVPSCGSTVRELAYDPSALVEALTATPLTLVHGNWKLGNLGRHPDGRTILLDWECPGAGRRCHRPGLVPGGQLGSPSRVQGSRHRGVPPGSGRARSRDRRLAGSPGHARLARRLRAVRLGEGPRRARPGAVVVGGQGARSPPPPRLTPRPIPRHYVRRRAEMTGPGRAGVRSGGGAARRSGWR